MEKIDEALSVTAANLVLPIMKDLIMPKIQKVLSIKKGKHTPEEISIVLQKYIENKYVQYSFIDTIAFANMQTLFDVLYEPLTIFNRQAENADSEFCIDNFPDKLFNDYYRVIIEDTGGMGKSTILKKIFKATIEDKRFIPVFIYLSKINENNSIINEIYSQINKDKESGINGELDKLLKDGDFIILFDGFDEISNINKEYAINNLHEFFEKYNNNYYVISTRPEDSILSFGDFMKFNVKPLTMTEACNIIRKYDLYNYKKIAEVLIEKIKHDANEDLREYLQNPFLVSLLYKSFDYTKDIPLKKTHFYGQVFDALFEQHDLSKETYLKRNKHSGLHKDDFERVLRWLGYLTLQTNSIEYDKDHLVKILGEVRSYISEIDFNLSFYLKDLLETVPLFRKDGGYIRWAHKSLQGYFAARFIWIDSREDQEIALKSMYDEIDNFKYIPIIELFYELDPHAFESTILMWFLTDLINYAENKRLLLDIEDINDVDIIANTSFLGNCDVMRAKDRIPLSDMMREKDIPKGKKMVGVINGIGSSNRDAYYKTVIVDYPQIEALFFLSYFSISNISAIYEFIYAKYPKLRADKYEEKLEDIQGLLLLETTVPYEVECDDESFFVKNKLVKSIAGLLSSNGTLDIEKCSVKLQEIRNKKSRAGLFKR